MTLEWCILGSDRQRDEVATMADVITPLDMGRVAPSLDCNSVPGRDCLECYGNGQLHPTRLPPAGPTWSYIDGTDGRDGTACRFSFAATDGEPMSTAGASKCFPLMSTDVMPSSNLKRIFEPESVVRVWTKHE
jgi:hypothetical protein